MRLGIFGGSFDPVHFGHLLLAETCREHARLDQVWFVPAAAPPHKRLDGLSPAMARIEMLQLAIGGHLGLAVSTIEVDRGGVSYTVQTLTEIHEQHPDATLFFLMGADSLQDLPTWREPHRICQLALPLVIARAGTAPPDLACISNYVDAQRLAEIRAAQIEAPVIELSSTDIRQRVREGRSIRFRTPRAVEEYIRSHGLYQRGAQGAESGEPEASASQQPGKFAAQ
jgi:nicotinate-nucleotide adenylyltransferase